MVKYFFTVFYLLISLTFYYNYLASIQLNNYKISKIIDFNNLKLIRYELKLLLNSTVFCIINLSIYKFNNTLIIISNIVFLVIFILINYKNKSIFVKTPLVKTNRLIRLIFAYYVLFILIISLFTYYVNEKMYLTIYPLFPIFNIVSIIFGCLLILPFEKINNFRYILKAHKKFVNQNIIKIGITGSYGKTSVKCILSHILSYKYKVACCLKNYNTELGLSISSKQINEKTDIFIAEMGARKRNDIKKLCKICPVDIGIITGICNQHNESFKNIDNIINTKSEILLNNPVMFFNGNNKYVKKIYNKYLGQKYITFDKNAYAKDINMTSSSTSFTLVINNEEVRCNTKLLGKSCVENIVLASMVANYLGMSLQEISEMISTLDYVEHRLEVKENNRFTIIDDSYNSNEIGINEALEVLNLFNKQKIVLVSGMVELGELERNINFNLGAKLSKIADKILLINTNQSKYILDGLFINNYDSNKVLIYNTVDECIKDLESVVDDNSVLLIMADLPSNYSR